MGGQTDHLGWYQHRCTDFHNRNTDTDNGICIIAYSLITNKFIKRHRCLFFEDPIGWIGTIKSVLRSCHLDNILIIQLVSFIYWRQYFSYKKLPFLMKVSFFLLEPALREDWIVEVVSEYESKGSCHHIKDLLLPAISVIWTYLIYARRADILISLFKYCVELSKRFFLF